MSEMPQEDELVLRGFLEPCWYRIEIGDGQIIVRRYPVIKHTPKGAWLTVGFSKKFMPRERKYRAAAFAAPTVEQAEEDYRQRKAFHILMLEGRLRQAKIALEALSDPWYREY